MVSELPKFNQKLPALFRTQDNDIRPSDTVNHPSKPPRPDRSYQSE